MDEKTPFDQLPAFWQREIRELRRESAKMRRERNEAREALAAASIAFANAAGSK